MDSIFWNNEWLSFELNGTNPKSDEFPNHTFFRDALYFQLFFIYFQEIT